jgi:hypothetical protein
VPIKYRGEFLSSVAFAEPGDSGTQQLDLPLTAPRSASVVTHPDGNKLCGGSSAGDFAIDSAIVLPAPAALQRQVVLNPTGHGAATKTSRFDPTGLLPLKQGKSARSASRFSPRGFLWGCVLGTAAAAILLLVLYLIFG